MNQFSTDHRQILVEILEMGLAGAAILEHLECLHLELLTYQEQRVQSYLERLPFRLMLPLVFFIFPSLLILLFGPLLGQIYLEVFQ